MPANATKTPGASVFPTGLGWFGLRWGPQGLQRSTIGHRSAAAAWKSLQWTDASSDEQPPWELQQRLTAFADGASCDFRDVPLDLPPLTAFQRRVLSGCREIPYGETVSYGQLAQLAGSPRAARAVGTVMAGNPMPVVIPCHRVIGSHQTLGGFSAPTGVSLKKRMLRLESDGARVKSPLASQR